MQLPDLETVRQVFSKTDIPPKEVWDAHMTLSPSWQSKFRTGVVKSPGYEAVACLVNFLTARGVSFDL